MQCITLPSCGYQRLDARQLTVFSCLVKLPHDRQATVQKITATDHIGPAFNTRSRTAQHNITEHLTSQLNADTVTPDIITVKDTPDAMPKPLTEDRLHTLLQMQRMGPFCKCISKHLLNRKAPKRDAELFLSTLKDYYINMSWIQTRNCWPLSYQKLGSTWCSWKHVTHLVTKELLAHTAS